MSELTRRELLKTGAVMGVAGSLGWHPNTAAALDYKDAVLVKGEPPKPKPGSFCVAVLPDTQLYAEKYPKLFRAQTEWLAANGKSRNIVFALHLGDITNHNTPAQWKNAVHAFRALDGKIPYAFCPGNHDYSKGGRATDRTTLLNEYLPFSRYEKLPTFGGTYDKEPKRMENSYHLFTAGKRDFVVIALEFGPRRDVVRWANEVAGKYKNRAAILITHAYMYYDETRYDWKKFGAKQKWNPHAYGVAKKTKGDVMDGTELWDNLVSKHENFVMTLNGHVLGDGLGRTTSTTPGGRTVHQMLVNFQMRPKGGDGWLRLMEFRADGKTVQMYDYSPTRNEHNQSKQNQFAIEMSAVK